MTMMMTMTTFNNNRGQRRNRKAFALLMFRFVVVAVIAAVTMFGTGRMIMTARNTGSDTSSSSFSSASILSWTSLAWENTLFVEEDEDEDEDEQEQEQEQEEPTLSTTHQFSIIKEKDTDDDNDKEEEKEEKDDDDHYDDEAKGVVKDKEELTSSSSASSFTSFIDLIKLMIFNQDDEIDNDDIDIDYGEPGEDSNSVAGGSSNTITITKPSSLLTFPKFWKEEEDENDKMKKKTPSMSGTNENPTKGEEMNDKYDYDDYDDYDNFDYYDSDENEKDGTEKGRSRNLRISSSSSRLTNSNDIKINYNDEHKTYHHGSTTFKSISTSTSMFSKNDDDDDDDKSPKRNKLNKNLVHNVQKENGQRDNKDNVDNAIDKAIIDNDIAVHSSSSSISTSTSSFTNDNINNNTPNTYTNDLVEFNRLLQINNNNNDDDTLPICSNISDTFKTTYVLLVQGNESLFTLSQANLLAATFVTSYNTQRTTTTTTKVCDPLFRTITKVDISSNISFTGVNQGEIIKNPLPIRPVRRGRQRRNLFWKSSHLEFDKIIKHLKNKKGEGGLVMVDSIMGYPRHKDDQLQQQRRQLNSTTSLDQQLNSTSLDRRPYRSNILLMLLDISGTCRGCQGQTQEFSLFDDISSSSPVVRHKGRRQQEEEREEFSLFDDISLSSSSPLVRRRQEDHDLQGKQEQEQEETNKVDNIDCVCPADAVVADATDFENSFNSKVEDLRESGEIEFVEQVEEVIPVLETKCPTKDQDFSTVLLVTDVTFSRSILFSLGVQGVEDVEVLFRDTYNGVSQQLCDPLYRSITKSQLVSIEQEAEQEQEGSETVRMEFVVEATCRGDNCIEVGCIFDDVTKCGIEQRERNLKKNKNEKNIYHSNSSILLGRPEEEEEMIDNSHIGSSRLLQEDDDKEERCFCRKGRSKRPPNPQEIQEAFQKGLDDITENNKLSSCQECSTAFDCQSGVCLAGRCAEEDTQLLLNTCTCNTNEQCESGFCQDTSSSTTTSENDVGGTCQGKLTSCRVCNNGEECLSGVCTGGKCAEAIDGKLKTGCDCTSSPNCQTGRCVDDFINFDVPGKCTEKISNTCTEPCLSSTDCLSGVCGSVVCMPLNGTLLPDGCLSTLRIECESGVVGNSICTPASAAPSSQQPSQEQSTPGPTFQPSPGPSTIPSSSPSTAPSRRPSTEPSTIPSTSPTPKPSTGPSSGPSKPPSTPPTTKPSTGPSRGPSTPPSGEPTFQPSHGPSPRPSAVPSTSPTLTPSFPPSSAPSMLPSTPPSASPTSTPSSLPSSPPTSPPTKLSQQGWTELGEEVVQMSAGNDDWVYGLTSEGVVLKGYQGENWATTTNCDRFGTCFTFLRIAVMDNRGSYGQYGIISDFRVKRMVEGTWYTFGTDNGRLNELSMVRDNNVLGGRFYGIGTNRHLYRFNGADYIKLNAVKTLKTVESPSEDNVWVIDTNDALFKYNNNGGYELGPLFQTEPGLRFRDIAIDSDNTMFAVDDRDGYVWKLDEAAGWKRYPDALSDLAMKTITAGKPGSLYAVGENNQAYRSRYSTN